MRLRRVLGLLLALLMIGNSYPWWIVLAASSPWSETDWTGQSGTNVTTSTVGQITVPTTENLTNTGFETDLTGWTGSASTFGDSNFQTASGAVAAWPLDDTTTTQSYARAINPSFTPTRNIVLNGTFDTDTLWTKGTGWTISGGVATATAAPTDGSGNMSQTIPLIVGKAYTVTYTISNYTGGTVRVLIGGSGTGTDRTANGTYTETIVASGTAAIYFQSRTSAFSGNIDDVTVTQVNVPSSTSSTGTQLLTDGDMETAGTSSWTVVNGATLSKQTTSPHGGSQVVRVTHGGVTNSPEAAQTIVTVGVPYRVTGYTRSDGNTAPRIRDTGTTLFTGTTSTSWQPFDFVYVPTTTRVGFGNGSSTAGQYTEFDDVVVSLDNYVRSDDVISTLDGDMETSGTGYWTANSSATVSKETTSPHGGTQLIRVAYGGVANPSASQKNLNTGKKYRVTGFARGDGTVVPRIYIGGNTLAWTGTSSTSWQTIDATAIADTSIFYLFTSNGTVVGQYTEFDDISVTEVAPLVGKNTNSVTLGSTAGGHLTTAYTFDGSNDNVNIYSSDLNSVFNPSEGTLIAWAKVSGSGVWTDGTTRYITQLQVNSSNQVILRRDSSNNYIRVDYIAGGTTKTVTVTTLGGNTSWFQFIMTWSKSGDEVKAYINGAQVGSTQTGLGTWVGNFGSTGVFIGAASTSGASPWSGLINDVRLYSRALSDSEIANLYTGATATRDTGTKYAGSASAKIVPQEGYNGKLVESVNVGDTNTYSLSAYTYTDGSAVTSSDVSLWYNNATVSTTYTSVGSGWYKLTGTVTGANEARDYGVQVLAGKTVYVDDLSLTDYTSGTLTSSIFDSGYSSNWGTLTYTATTPSNTTATVKVRTSNSSSMSGATDFSSCSAISSGSDISSDSCVTDGHRYGQYYVTLSSSDGVSTPTFSDFSLTFANAVSPTGSISIGGGATYSTSTSVTLTLSASDDVDSASGIDMFVSNNSDFSTGSYEDYATSKSWTLASTTDGSQTVYVKFRDANSNESSSYSDSITLDSTAPASFDLESPGDASYTSNSRPTFKWKVSSDGGSGLSHYQLFIDNGDSGDITIDSIPLTADYTTAKYVVDYDSSGYISVYTKSSSSWESSQNDGKVKEGERGFRVTAYDSAGNGRSHSRIFYADQSSPTLTATVGDDKGSVDGYQLINTNQPTFTGTITDNLNIEKLVVSYYKQNLFLGIITSEELVDQETLSRSSTTSTTNTATSWSYSFKTSKDLTLGKYKTTVAALDKAGNQSSQEFSLNLLTLDKINLLLAQEGETPTSGEGEGKISIPDLEKQAIIRRELEAKELTNLKDQILTLLSPVSGFLANLLDQGGTLLETLAEVRLPEVRVPEVVIPNLDLELPRLAINLPEINLPEVNLPEVNLPGINLPIIKVDYTAITKTSENLAESINRPARALKDSLDSLIENSVITLIKTGQDLAVNYEEGRLRTIQKANDLWPGEKLVEATDLVLREIRKPVGHVSGVFERVAIWLGTFESIVISNDPTKISDVTVEEVGDDYAIISFKTNHFAYGKVNYGETLAYGEEVDLPKREKIHKARLTGLKKGGKYFFEVMAQNKNYAYDAYYTLQMPGE